METREITDIVNSQPYMKDVFLGVFPCDKLPDCSTIFRRPLAFIANTDESFLPGEHWVAFYFPARGPNEYFDSYGFPPLKFPFQKALGKYYIYNDKLIQSFSSAVCGEYCIYFCLMRVCNSNMNKALSMFSEDSESNDNYVKQYVMHIVYDKCTSRHPIFCQNSLPHNR